MAAEGDHARGQRQLRRPGWRWWAVQASDRGAPWHTRAWRRRAARRPPTRTITTATFVAPHPQRPLRPPPAARCPCALLPLLPPAKRVAQEGAARHGPVVDGRALRLGGRVLAIGHLGRDAAWGHEHRSEGPSGSASRRRRGPPAQHEAAGGEHAWWGAAGQGRGGGGPRGPQPACLDSLTGHGTARPGHGGLGGSGRRSATHPRMLL